MSDLKAALSRHVQEQTPITPPCFTGIEARAHQRSRRRYHRCIAASVAVPGVLAVTVFYAVLPSDPAPSGPMAQAPASNLEATRPPPEADPTAPRAAPDVDSGPSPAGTAASCVEAYDLTTVRRSAFAFDGTVSRIVPMQPLTDGRDPRAGYLSVTFIVHEWFRGGDQATVTVDMVAPTVNSVQDTSYGIGTRLLVSGAPRWGGSPLQAPVAWGCGFTRYYDESTAASWRQAFRQK